VPAGMLTASLLPLGAALFIARAEREGE